MANPITFPVRATSNQRAVLFIHGFGGDSHQTFGMLPAFLAGSPELFDWDIHCVGYPTSLAPDISGVWSADPDLASLSGWLATLITAGRYIGYREIAFVAHSMGGLIVQRALLDGGFVDRVRVLALFGTPSNGLLKAGLAAIFKRQVRDMKRRGRFITSLRGDWSARFGAGVPFRFAAVAGLKDEFVPEDSSIECFPKQFHQRVPGDHLQMVKPRTADEDTAVLLLNLLGRDAPGRVAAVPIPARVSAEDVVARAGAVDTLSTEGLVKLALALEMTGGQEQAISLLEPRHAGNTELTGVLAGRLKRRWLADPDGKPEEGRRAYQLYRAAFEQASAANDDTQAYYNGINVAFMQAALHSDLQGAREVAASVIFHCERARRTGKADRWLLATEGEAALYTGEFERALRLYEEALADIMEERERGSMLRQGIWACRLLGEEEAEVQLKALYDPSLAGFPELKEPEAKKA